MVNSELNRSTEEPKTVDLVTASKAVAAYVALTVATVVALIVMSAGVARHQATGTAWGHAVIVCVFAILLPLRMRAARNGSARAVRAVTIIASVILVVNVVEAALPHGFPGWMRIEMVVIALLMAVLVGVMTGRIRR